MVVTSGWIGGEGDVGGGLALLAGHRDWAGLGGTLGLGWFGGDVGSGLVVGMSGLGWS